MNSPLFLCGSFEETERLNLRGIDAIDGTVAYESHELAQHRRRWVIVTPSARHKAIQPAAMLHGLCCQVEQLPADADLNAPDLLVLPRTPMFPRVASKIFDSGAALLSDIRAFVLRFVSFPTAWSADAVALWAAHAHMVEHFHTTPRLAILSPEPESGKTRTLEILDVLTPASMLVFSPSVAAIFRKLALEQVTLLFDEVDTIFTKRGKDDQNEDLRALLNAGYRRGASIPRCVGPKHDVQDFKVFAAVALAGIGDLPDTIMTRSIVIRMRRRSASEPIEQYRVRLNEAEGHLLRDQLAAWAATVGPDAGAAWPDLPDGVSDRRAEAWEPLISIADIAGGDWPERVRVAAVADVAAYMERTPSLGIRLLMDIRQVFGDRDAVPTVELLKSLNEMEESPWGDLGGKPMDFRSLAARLKKYSVKSKVIRVGMSTPRGYAREDLYDVWQRYLDSDLHPHMAATSATNATPEGTH